jgi:uncharacterized protein with GYD domain
MFQPTAATVSPAVRRWCAARRRHGEEGTTVVTYVVLCRFTQQGIAEIKSAPERIRANAERAREAGLAVKGVYLTMGEYDQVLIIEAPDDETMATGLLMLGQQGNLRTTALRAFDAEAAARIIGRLP